MKVLFSAPTAQIPISTWKGELLYSTPSCLIHCTCIQKFPNNFPLKDQNKLACHWNLSLDKKNTYLTAQSNIVTAKDDMHSFGFTSCPSGEHFLSLFWDALWQWTQRQDSISYLFLHRAGSWCSCIQSQDFPRPALAVRCVVITATVVNILTFTAREGLNCRRVVAKFWGRKAGF